MSQATFSEPAPANCHHAPSNGQNGGGEPEVQTIRLAKTNGMGLSIVAAKGNRNEKLGIYIKAVVEGGAAWQDGRLQAGDQLLSCDGASLVGITQERAAQLMMSTGPTVTIQVAKLGAFYDGLDQLLLQPSPVLARHPDPGPRRQLTGPAPPQLPGRLPQSKSLGALQGGPPPPGPASPGDQQHNYQNQEWINNQLPPRHGKKIQKY